MQPSSRTFWTMRSVAFVLGKHEVTRGVGNFLFVQMSNRMPISVQGYVTLELHLRSVGLVHVESFAWPQHYVFIPQCGFSRNSAKVIGFGNKPLFQKKRESCTKQLKRFSGVGPGCQDSLAASERFSVCAAQANSRGNRRILAPNAWAGLRWGWFGPQQNNCPWSSSITADPSN